MYTKYLIIIFSIIFYPLFGQLRMEIEVINSVASINIYNDSENNYAFPLDINHLRPYEADCHNFSDKELEFPNMALMVNIEKADNIKEDYNVGYYRVEDKFDPLIKKANIERSNFKKEIQKWRKKNKIANYDVGLINYSIIKNLVYLKSKEKISFKIKLDLYNITNQELIFYNYILDKAMKYKLFMSLCEFDELESYFTLDQKQKLKEYKLFKGSIQSNKIQL